MRVETIFDMRSQYLVYCGECCFLLNEDINGNGGCALQDYVGRNCSELCDLDHAAMRKDCLLRGLHYLQKWRRSNSDKAKMPPPYVVGKLIDAAIYKLRQM